MNRHHSLVILKLLGEIVLFALVAGIVVVLIGYWRKWDSSLEYSNAFFIAGCFLIVGGMLSRYASIQSYTPLQNISSDSFREMSPGERVGYIVEASSPYRLVVIGLMSGIILFLISAYLAKLL